MHPGAAGWVNGSPAGGLSALPSLRRTIEGMWNKREDQLVHQAEPFNAEPRSAALGAALITPVDTFYSRNHGPIPDLDERSWRLEVGGMVRRTLSSSLDDLRSRYPRRTVTAALQCAGNRRDELAAVHEIPGESPWRSGAVGTAEWVGVALDDVLEDAGVADDARHVVLAAPDVSQTPHPPQAYEASVPLGKARRPEVLLAWEMNGAPLMRVHGAPVRAVVPGYIGARSVKWVQRITLQEGPAAGYYQATAYRLLPADADPSSAGPEDGLSLGPAPITSAILSPEDGERLAGGTARVRGYALSGDGRGVARVDVSADGGVSWQQADLGEDLGPWAWRLWNADVTVPEGDTVIVSRAWDTSASSQPSDPATLWNPKGYMNTAWGRVHVQVRPAERRG